jgi:hypothetical protein
LGAIHLVPEIVRCACIYMTERRQRGRNLEATTVAEADGLDTGLSRNANWPTTCTSWEAARHCQTLEPYTGSPARPWPSKAPKASAAARDVSG